MISRPMRVREASRRYNLPIGRIYAAISAGDLNALNIGTKLKASYLVTSEDVEAWLSTLSTAKRSFDGGC